tara:strand:- start:4576 stop:4764 length:189 start_codon:yes stop_codon:yes gene_type:complete
MLNQLKSVAVIVTTSALIAGCATIRKSEIPFFIQKLEEHSFTPEEKQTIGEILRYVNELESQ